MLSWDQNPSQSFFYDTIFFLHRQAQSFGLWWSKSPIISTHPCRPSPDATSSVQTTRYAQLRTNRSFICSPSALSWALSQSSHPLWLIFWLSMCPFYYPNRLSSKRLRRGLILTNSILNRQCSMWVLGMKRDGTYMPQMSGSEALLGQTGVHRFPEWMGIRLLTHVNWIHFSQWEGV